MTNYGSLYKTYLKKFYNAERQSKEKQLPMAWNERINKDDFKAWFEATKASLKEQGVDPSNTQVVKAIIDRQQYGSSMGQGKALQKAMALRGIDVDLATARAYQAYVTDPDAFAELPASLRKNAKEVQSFYDEIENFYQDKKRQGFDTSVIKQLIAQVYFGSV